jgi:hypothetical protein
MIWMRMMVVKLAVTEPIALEASPEASVERVQVEEPQASKRAWPVVTERVTAVLGMGVTPSSWRACTVKGVTAGGVGEELCGDERKSGLRSGVVERGGHGGGAAGGEVTDGDVGGDGVGGVGLGTVAVMEVEVQPVTAAGRPLTVTALRGGRKPMPVMVTVPPMEGTVAGEMESA